MKEIASDLLRREVRCSLADVPIAVDPRSDIGTAHPSALPAATDEAESDAAQSVDSERVVPVPEPKGLDPIDVEHVRQSRLRRWQAQRPETAVARTSSSAGDNTTARLR